MKITMEGKYQTRDGRPVRILCTDLKGCGWATVIGLIEGSGGSEFVESWSADGEAIRNEIHRTDLVPVPKEYQLWVVVGRTPSGPVYAKTAWNIQDVWVLNDGDVLLARKLVEIKEGDCDDEVHSS
jgi:hypothetical protein